MSKVLEQKLEEYTKTCKSIERFEEKYSDVFKHYKSLMENKEEQEKELKDLAREEGSIENNRIVVKVSEVWKKWFDYKKFTTKVDSKTIAKIEEAGGIKAEVSYEVVNKLIKQEEIKIDPELIQNSYLEEKQTSKVSIKIKEQE